jgi:hypothetical protein
MTLDQARKFLALKYKIRRKVWKKHCWCTGFFKHTEPDKAGIEYMVLSMNGKKAYQRVTRLEETAMDWEKVA